MAHFCKNCGTSIPDGAGFCPKCGTPSSSLPTSNPYVQSAEEYISDPTPNPITKLLDYIDDGRFFREPLVYLYRIIGALCILPAIGLLFYMCSDAGEYLKFTLGSVVSMIVLFIVTLAAGVFSCFLWFNRANKLQNKVEANSEMVVMPLCADLLQTMLECSGLQVMLFYPLFLLYYGIIGQALSPLTSSSEYIVIFVGTLLFAVLLVLLGYILVLASHYVGESIRAIAIIVNDLRKISKKQ